MHTEIKADKLRSSHKRSLSVVLLCFNDGAVIRKCVEQAFKALEPITSQLQVIVIEDGSRDDSSDVLLRLKALYPSLEVVFHRQNQGYGRSLAEGIGVARNEYVLCSDGDNQFDFRDGIPFLKSADGGYEIVSGRRRPRADQWYRHALGWICNVVVHFTFALQVDDVDCGFKLMERHAAQSLFPTRSNLAVWVEAMATAERYGYRCTNLNVHHRARESGRSTVFNLASIVRLGRELVSLGVRFKLQKRLEPAGNRTKKDLERGDKTMKPIQLCLFAFLLVGGIALFKPWNVTAQSQGDDSGMVLKNTQPNEFQPTPIMPQCFLGAMQRINPETGAAVFLIRADAKQGCVVPLHWHTSGEQITVVSGIVTLKMADGTSHELKEGGYAYIPPKHVHLFSCAGPCIHFVQSDGPYDIHYVSKEGKELSLSEALKGTQ